MICGSSLATPKKTARKVAILAGTCGCSASYEMSSASSRGQQRNNRRRRAAAMKMNLFWFYLMLQVVFVSGCLAGRDHESSVAGWKQLKRRPYRGSALSSHTKRISPIERLRSSRTTSYSYLHDGHKNRRKPNIILFVTDDQDVELGSLNFMSETSRLMREGGAEFRHAYATTPMCCPSRSSMLTGLYVHNHNVYTNNDNCSNSQWQMEHESRSFATYLHNAGYHTGYFGKYLNKYNGSHIPPGWQEWAGLIMNSRYYNYSINFNGKKIRHGNDYSKDYYTDLIANDSVNFLRQWKSENANKPTLLVMSFPAPHGPEDSAPQFSDMFFNVTSHHTPSYDYAPNLDKQWILRVTEKMFPIHKRFTDLLMTKRLQTLQSVDKAVKRIFDVLKETGELENTYMIYTSDHGYHLGQFGLIKGKSFPFEFDVRIPFLVRGPGIEPGSIVNEIALNIDLAPTILDIADIQIPQHMDGRSLVKLFNKRKKSVRKYLSNWPDTFLIESSGRRDVFMPISDSPSNKNSLDISGNVFTSSILESEESAVISNLPANSSTENTIIDEKNLKLESSNEPPKNDISLVLIRSTENTTSKSNALLSSKAERLSVECQQASYSYPCITGQKWYCVQKHNRWRKHKCRFLSQKEDDQKTLQKCTCVTEEGIVYLRFQAVDGLGEQNSGFHNIHVHPTIIHYLKSNKSADELVNELAKTWQIMRRHRRSSSRPNYDEEVSSMTPVVDLVDGQMIELPGISSKSNTTTCMVLYDGSIRCSPEIYDSPVLLQLGKEQLILEIRKLQLQIKKLKNIHRHLERKHTALTNVNNNINPESIGARWSEADSANVSSQENLKNHKHRHQRIEPNRNANRTFYTQLNDYWNEKERSDGTIPDACYCVPHSQNEYTPSETEEDIVKSQKQFLREQKKKKKERKLKKKAKFERECFQEKMNCFTHDSQHWRTPPFWNDDPFCFCMNANNNTYTCLRTINATHNFLYCEFVTGWITYYNLRIDPFQQWNRFNSLSTHEKTLLKSTLSQLSKCKGFEECGYRSSGRRISNVESHKKISVLDRKNKKNTTYQTST